MELAIGDPWLYLTAFGLIASAGLLIYLVKQLNAASDDEEEAILDEEHAPAPAPAPAPVVKSVPAPSIKATPPPMTLRPDVKIQETVPQSAAEAVSGAIGTITERSPI